MNELSNAIINSQISIQEFAKKVKIPYYRIAKILYGEAQLKKVERQNIEKIFGHDIFFDAN